MSFIPPFEFQPSGKSWADMVEEEEKMKPAPSVPAHTRASEQAARVRTCTLNAKYGRCFFGKRYAFEHEREPLIVCKHWPVKKADCPYGEKCDRDHGAVEIAMPTGKFPVWCVKAAEKGVHSCSYGRKCTYLHPEDLQPHFRPE